MNIFTKSLMQIVGLKLDMQKQVISSEELRSIVSEAGEATQMNNIHKCCCLFWIWKPSLLMTLWFPATKSAV